LALLFVIESKSEDNWKNANCKS